ncbi:MAG: hypothetical protein CPSOU_2063 [uncultured Paraburkholderia sp.]|nr:MAG: hypothetical protein CPSOU_2063 [uncultured Paraburkholderia sp.]
MTLKYIARNPYLVRSVVQAIEVSFTEDFTAIISGLRSGVYAGSLADELAGKLASRETLFAGEVIRAEIHDYVSHLVRSGEPIYIHRTSLGAGAYCLTHDNHIDGPKPPCIDSHSLAGGSLPNPNNCHIECRNLILLDAAKTGLRQNIVFYSNLVASGQLKERTLGTIAKKVELSERRLVELETRSASLYEIASFARKAQP